MKNSKHFNLFFRPEPEGGYTVIVPSLPGCVTYGRTLEEAKKMAIDAIQGYLVSLRKHKESVPNDDESFITTLDLDFSFPYAASA